MLSDIHIMTILLVQICLDNQSDIALLNMTSASRHTVFCLIYFHKKRLRLGLC